VSETGAAMVGLAALIAATQWLWMRVVAHVDLLLVPAHARRRVVRLRSSSTRIYLATGAVVAGVVCAEAALLLS
jgi:hypothetical protein